MWKKYTALESENGIVICDEGVEAGNREYLWVVQAIIR
jgi:hypothetical protein